MKFFAFTKLGMIRIVASSLMLSVYVYAILVNFASDELTTGSLIATVLFILSAVAFSLFAKMKNHPPLLAAVKGWLIASFATCIITFFVAISGDGISGFIGTALGWGAMLFVSPFYGFGYLLGKATAVSISGIVSCVLIRLLPFAIEKLIERRRLLKKLR